jgi:hypothetical protein
MEIIPERCTVACRRSRRPSNDDREEARTYDAIIIGSE